MTKEAYKPAYLREKKARKSAEKILEEKSLELYELNQKLLKSNELLEKRVKDRTEELLDSKLRAEKLARIKSNFLSMMSHEMRTPLNGILGYTNLLLEEKLDEEQRDYLLRINYSGEVLLSIINDVLANSRIDAGKEIVRNIKFNLKDEITGLLKVFEKYGESKNIDYIHTFENDLDQIISTDLSKLKQIIINLIGNAVKFTDAGYVHIFVSLDGVNLKIQVVDSGVGIKDEDQKKIFEEYTQVESDKTYLYSGTGLGLSITKRLTELLGGQISVESQWGKGSNFTVKIPIEIVSEKLDKVAKSSSDVEVKVSKILVVDDNKLNRDLLQRILVKHVYVETANGAKQCIEKIKNEEFELVFMDLRMPEVDGLELSKILKEKYSYQGKIILLSAEPLDKEKDEELINFFDGYLSKPFKIQDVLNFLKS